MNCPHCNRKTCPTLAPGHQDDLAAMALCTNAQLAKALDERDAATTRCHGLVVQRETIAMVLDLPKDANGLTIFEACVSLQEKHEAALARIAELEAKLAESAPAQGE